MIFPQNWELDEIDNELIELDAELNDMEKIDQDDMFYNNKHPVAAHQITGTNDEGFIYFRLKLNDNPLDEDITKPNILKELLWGIDIKSETDDRIFTTRIYPFENSNMIEILDSDDRTIYSEPAVFADAPEAVNLEVSKNDNKIEDLSNSDSSKYFLDFKLPRKAFINDSDIFDFEKENYKLGDFSSEAYSFAGAGAIAIAKSSASGKCNYHIRPDLEITKEIVSGDDPICEGEEGVWQLKITVKNPLTNFEPLTNIIVNDFINCDLYITDIETEASKGVAIFNELDKKITWTISSLGIGESATLTIDLLGIFSEPGLEVLNTGCGYGRGAWTCLYTKKVDFSVRPIIVEKCDQPTLKIIKELISGDDPVCVNEEGMWELQITVTNPLENDEELIDILVQDYINPDLEITDIDTDVSKGTAIFDPGDKKITWTIPSLDVGESAILLILLSGIFAETGKKILNVGSGIGKGKKTGLYTPEVEFMVKPIKVIVCEKKTRGIDLFDVIE